jgi:hypothetical protein
VNNFLEVHFAYNDYNICVALIDKRYCFICIITKAIYFPFELKCTVQIFLLFFTNLYSYILTHTLNLQK